MNRISLARPTCAQTRRSPGQRRSRLPVALVAGAALSLTACSVEADPLAWSPTVSDVVVTSGDASPTTGDAAPTTAPTTAEPTTAEPTGDAGADLEGNTWVLGISFLQDSAATTATNGDRQAQLTFRDGTLQVRTGCNQGSAAYQVSGDRLSLDPLVLTKRACEGDGAAIEALMVGLLGQQELTFAVEGGGLTLTAADGTSLGFTRVSAAGGDNATETARPTGTATAPTQTTAPTGTATPPAPTTSTAP